MTSPPRQQVIIEAAYHLIAERGFEGFRVRAVADQVAINHATLLHYFPTKQHLVEAVVGYLLEQLQQEGNEHQHSSPFAALCQEFDDFRKRLIHEREFFVVLSELQLRAYRDPAIARALTPMYTQWRWYLTSIVERGVRAGQFRSDTPVSAVVDILILQFRGLSLRALEPCDNAGLNTVIQSLCSLLHQWIVQDS